MLLLSDPQRDSIAIVSLVLAVLQTILALFTLKPRVPTASRGGIKPTHAPEDWSSTRDRDDAYGGYDSYLSAFVSAIAPMLQLTPWQAQARSFINSSFVLSVIVFSGLGLTRKPSAGWENQVAFVAAIFHLTYFFMFLGVDSFRKLRKRYGKSGDARILSRGTVFSLAVALTFVPVLQWTTDLHPNWLTRIIFFYTFGLVGSAVGWLVILLLLTVLATIAHIGEQ
jgi:hypothetical protein